MAENSDPKTQQPDDLQTVLARAKGLVQSLDSEASTQEELLLGFDTPLPPPAEAAIPVALPVMGDVSEDVPVAIPVLDDADNAPAAVALPGDAPPMPPEPNEDLIET